MIKEATKQIELLKMDYTRYNNGAKWNWYQMLQCARRIPGFHYIMWLRFSAGTEESRIPFLHRFCVWRLTKLGIKYGFDIPYNTKIGGDCPKTQIR